MATSYETPLPSHHKANKLSLSNMARLRNLDITFLEIERQKELDSSAINRGVLLYFELTPSVIRRDSHDMIIIFRAARV